MKQKNVILHKILLFMMLISIMLCSTNLVSAAIVSNSEDKGNNTTLQTSIWTYNDGGLQSTKTYIENGTIYVDTSTGKLSKNSDQWIQVNAGTSIFMPVIGKGTISFKLYKGTKLTFEGKDSAGALTKSSDFIGDATNSEIKSPEFIGATLAEFYGDSATESEKNDTKKYIKINVSVNGYIGQGVKLEDTIVSKGVPKSLISGTITGFDENDYTKLTITLSGKNTEDISKTYSVNCGSNGSYSIADVDYGSYVLSISGTDSYELTSDSNININTAESTINTVLSKIPLFNVIGSYSIDLIKGVEKESLNIVAINNDTNDSYNTEITQKNINEDTLKFSIKDVIPGEYTIKVFNNNNEIHSYKINVSKPTDSATEVTLKDAKYSVINLQIAAPTGIMSETVQPYIGFTNFENIKVFDAKINFERKSSTEAVWEKTLIESVDVTSAQKLSAKVYLGKPATLPWFTDFKSNDKNETVNISWKENNDSNYPYTQTMEASKVEESNTYSMLFKIDETKYLKNVTVAYNNLYVDKNYSDSQITQNENYFNNIQDAVNFIKQTGFSTCEEERIIINIAPNVYREQVIIDLPYITLKNTSNEPTLVALGNGTSSKDAIITWYYGYGCKYYSADNDGYYNTDSDKQTSVSNAPSNWGASVYVKNTATAFKAEGITFENSYNLYVTDKEKTDISGSDSTYNITAEQVADRKATNANEVGNVSTKGYTERATALLSDVLDSEFTNCAIRSSQDSFITNRTTNNVSGVLNNCVIQGNTDYICGNGTYTFNNCDLVWGGYSDASVAGYISAPKGNYTFNDCTIKNNSYNMHKAGYLARAWETSCSVRFNNTKLETSDVISDIGWADWGDEKKAEDQDFAEYNTTVNGATVNYINSTVRANKVIPTIDYTNAVKNNDNTVTFIAGIREFSNADNVGFVYSTSNTTISTLINDIKEKLPESSAKIFNTDNVHTSIGFADNIYKTNKSSINNANQTVDNAEYLFADTVNNITGNIYALPFVEKDGLYYYGSEILSVTQ